MSEFVYISDSYLDENLGGGELNDYEILLILESQGHKITRYKSDHITKIMLRNFKNHNFIISNFANLFKDCKDYITKNCNYIIYEHDHKYLIGRNPALFKDYKAPKEQIINVEFYTNAKAVFCQTSFHEKIIKTNLNIENIINVSGNIWSEEAFEILTNFSLKEKKDKYSVLDSVTWHKNTNATSFYCQTKGYDYELISSFNYKEFLNKMSNNSKFIFLPKTPETLSRVIVEARMMGIKTISNKNVGACYEPWFKMKGIELISEMKQRRQQIPDTILRVFNEK